MNHKDNAMEEERQNQEQDDEESESVSNVSSKLKSKVWQYFTLNGRETFAKCNFCQKDFRRKSRKYGTSNMHRHLEKKHPNESGSNNKEVNSTRDHHKKQPQNKQSADVSNNSISKTKLNDSSADDLPEEAAAVLMESRIAIKSPEVIPPLPAPRRSKRLAVAPSPQLDDETRKQLFTNYSACQTVALRMIEVSKHLIEDLYTDHYRAHYHLDNQLMELNGQMAIFNDQRAKILEDVELPGDV